MEPAFPRAPPATRGLKGTTGLRAAIGFYLALGLTLLTRLIAPLAILRTAFIAVDFFYNGNQWSLSFTSLLSAWCICEVLFVALCYLRAHNLSKRRLPLAFPPSERSVVLERILEWMARAAADSKCVDQTVGSKVVPGRCNDDCPHTLLRGWMRGIPWQQVSSEEAQSWLSWALFAAPQAELAPLQRSEVASAIRELQKRTKIVFPCVRNVASGPGGNSPIRLTLDDVVWTHRPLVSYLVTHVIAGMILTPLLMVAHGFRRLPQVHDGADVIHWYRPGAKQEGAAAVSDGICFLHGIGAGPMPYLSMFDMLATRTGLPILVVEVPYIALRWALPDIRGPDATAESIAAALRSVGMQRATVVGHSFGTVMSAWLLRHCPELVHSVCLIDPVSLLLARADVAYAAIHKRPQNSIDVLLEYFVFRELSVAGTLARYFIWHRNVMWAEQLPTGGRSVAVLCSNDVIVPADAVRRYLEDHAVETVWLQGVGHAGFLLRDACVERVVNAIQRVSSTKATSR